MSEHVPLTDKQLDARPLRHRRLLLLVRLRPVAPPRIRLRVGRRPRPLILTLEAPTNKPSRPPPQSMGKSVRAVFSACSPTLKPPTQSQKPSTPPTPLRNHTLVTQAPGKAYLGATSLSVAETLIS